MPTLMPNDFSFIPPSSQKTETIFLPPLLSLSPPRTCLVGGGASWQSRSPPHGQRNIYKTRSGCVCMMLLHFFVFVFFFCSSILASACQFCLGSWWMLQPASHMLHAQSIRCQEFQNALIDANMCFFLFARSQVTLLTGWQDSSQYCFFFKQEANRGRDP